MAERTVVTKVTNAVHYSDGTIRIDNVRLSYPHLDEPYKSEGEDGSTKLSYNLEAMLPKDTHMAAKDLVKQVLLKLQTDNDVKVKMEHWCLKNGDDSDNPQYEGHFLVKAADSRRPSVRNRDGSVMSEREIADKIYGGCWANILIRPWYFNGKAKNGKTYPKRLLSNLVGVQFVRDDEAFGEGRISDEGVFGAVGGGDGMDDDDGGL